MSTLVVLHVYQTVLRCLIYEGRGLAMSCDWWGWQWHQISSSGSGLSYPWDLDQRATYREVASEVLKNLSSAVVTLGCIRNISSCNYLISNIVILRSMHLVPWNMKYHMVEWNEMMDEKNPEGALAFSFFTRVHEVFNGTLVINQLSITNWFALQNPAWSNIINFIQSNYGFSIRSSYIHKKLSSQPRMEVLDELWASTN